MAKTLPKEGTPEWSKFQTAKKTLMANPEMASGISGMSISEAQEIVDSYGIKMDRGGTVVGESHKNGGVPFELKDTGTHIEEEGKEINIPKELTDSLEIYELEGTNWEILNKILRLGGLSLKSEVTDVRSGDIVICIKSAWDDTPRKYKGTIKQILSAINESRGCKHIESGAVMENVETGEMVEMGVGGTAGKLKSNFSSYYAQHGALITGGSYFNQTPALGKGGSVKGEPMEFFQAFEKYIKGKKVMDSFDVPAYGDYNLPQEKRYYGFGVKVTGGYKFISHGGGCSGEDCNTSTILDSKNNIISKYSW